MPFDFNTSRGPVDLLIYMEHQKRNGGLDAVDEQRYTELIEVLHTMSDADQGRLTEGLITLAVTMNSPGAARALRGLRLADRRRHIVGLIAKYPEDPKVAKQTDIERHTRGPREPHPSYNLPLVLCETTDPAEIQLLAQCSRFQRADGSRTADDIAFCTNSIEALSTIPAPAAQDALIVALASDSNAIYSAALKALYRYCTNETRTLCRELATMPKQEAIRKLARMEGKGGLTALRTSLFQSTRYDRFFSSLKTFSSR